ncbi:RNA polymerase sigma factor [Dactylosporangium sp. CA-139066]|uniref:RNA polymerase sigma factor n=1 Tax=Dactylosporangium sp. CA-139066 TaxID=3239930 RepID=UPI003D92D8A3
MDDSEWAGFTAFVRATLPALGAFARALTGDRDDAQDLVQDTLVRLARAWRTLERASNPQAYAKTTMVRLHVTGLRRIQRWRRWMPVEAASRRDGPDPAIDRIVERDGLQAALRNLPPSQRAVLVLTYFDDDDDVTIGRMLRRSPGSVRVLRHRALGRLRAALASSEAAEAIREQL